MYVHGIRALFIFEEYVVQTIPMTGALVQVDLRREGRYGPLERFNSTVGPHHPSCLRLVTLTTCSSNCAKNPCQLIRQSEGEPFFFHIQWLRRTSSPPPYFPQYRSTARSVAWGRKLSAWTIVAFLSNSS